MKGVNKMKFVAGNPKLIKEEEIRVFFWVEEDDYGDIILKAKREDDNSDTSWNILVITSNGLRRSYAVSKELGLSIGIAGRIMLNETE